jgi:predicted GIY-YIG superfamily endonuclease
MAQKRDTSKYECYQGNKLVYVGITNDMARREAEHKAEGMNFSSMRKVGNVTTREAASDWETERIQKYQRNHGGNTPTYNQNNTGK